jgi:hypothetical protein
MENSLLALGAMPSEARPQLTKGHGSHTPLNLQRPKQTSHSNDVCNSFHHNGKLVGPTAKKGVDSARRCGNTGRSESRHDKGS